MINALFLVPGKVGGSETYLRGLVQGLGEADSANEYMLCLGPEAALTFADLESRWRIVTSPTLSASRPTRLIVEQTWLPRMAAKLGVDVVHSAGYTAPLLCSTARVTSIHDMNYKRHPEDLSLAERLVYAALIPPIARVSRRILALSSFARSDILRWTGAHQSNVAVVYPGVRKQWPGTPEADGERLAAAGIGERFVVTVAASYPHKNLRRLIDAFLADVWTRPEVQLVVVGLKGRAHPAIEAAAARHPGVVKVLGWIDEALLAALYRRSIGLAFPSLYEGFGLPIIEAMALGAPVLTSRIGAMAEVADGACELVNPFDVGSIRDGLDTLINNGSRREELRRLGLQRAKDFTWERTAEQTLRIYEAAVGVAPTGFIL